MEFPSGFPGLAPVGVGLAIGLWVATPERNAQAVKSVERIFITSAAQAQESKDGETKETETVSPVLARPRDTYYPNTEDLNPDEMRVVACGMGMPTTRAAQAAEEAPQLRQSSRFLLGALEE